MHRSLLLAFCVLFTPCFSKLSSRLRSQNEIIHIERFDVNPLTENLEVGSFSWSSCSGPNALAHIEKLEVSDPLSVPGNVTFSVVSSLKGNIVSPLKISVVVQRKISFIWIDVPCFDNVGSCTYEDFCAVIPYGPDTPCPEPFLSLGLPCYCPVSQGDYNFDKQTVAIPDEHVPKFLESGQYRVEVHASSLDQEVVCFKASFSLV